MIWDGKSPGTALNVLRLVRREESRAAECPRRTGGHISRHRMIGTLFSPAAIAGLSRFVPAATPEEWMPVETPQSGFFDAGIAEPSRPTPSFLRKDR